MEHKTGCAVCGAPLEYQRTPVSSVCHYCGESLEANARCARGHFVCDGCHGLPAKELIARYAKASSSKDPLEMALALMNNPAVKMHGPEHHLLVAAVLVSAYHNAKGETAGKAEKIDEALRRAEKVPGGSCGFNGNCGAAVGTGIFVSVVTGSTPLAREEWGLSNLMTARSLLRIAENGGPRCCKRDVYIALQEATAFSAERLGVGMERSGAVRCGFSSLNKECRKGKCPFHGRQG